MGGLQCGADSAGQNGRIRDAAGFLMLRAKFMMQPDRSPDPASGSGLAILHVHTSNANGMPLKRGSGEAMSTGRAIVAASISGNMDCHAAERARGAKLGRALE